ncbi:MAG: hypothetical protein ACI9WS_001566 [Paraglaciecola psychrophila]|jgi:hypothetical protein
MSYLSAPYAQETLLQAAAVVFLLYSGLCLVAKSIWAATSVDYYALPIGTSVPVWFRSIAWMVLVAGAGLFLLIIKNI